MSITVDGGGAGVGGGGVVPGGVVGGGVDDGAGVVADGGVVAPVDAMEFGVAAEDPPPHAVNVSVAERLTTNNLAIKENRRNTFLLGDFGCVTGQSNGHANDFRPGEDLICLG